MLAHIGKVLTVLAGLDSKRERGGGRDTYPSLALGATGSRAV